LATLIQERTPPRETKNKKQKNLLASFLAIGQETHADSLHEKLESQPFPHIA
jgi:hypothetical protein